MISFARVDDRLIHGQVVQGWLPKLDVQEVVVVSPLPERPLQALIRMSLPPEYELHFFEVNDAAAKTAQIDKKVFILFSSLEDALKVINDGLEIKNLNIGGLHYKEGRAEIASDVFASQAEKDILKSICQKGIEVDARSVSNASKTDIKGNLCL